MFLTMAIGMTIGCLVISIGVYRTIPEEFKIFRWAIPMRRAIRNHKVIALVLNFALSKAITSFIGAGMAAGFANLTGSILFGVYLWAEPWIIKVWPYRD